MKMEDLNKVTDYIIVKLHEGEVPLNLLKLHKLLYYVQAWSLAFGKGRAFNEEFQAWVHGPVSRQIYDRFKNSKTLYSSVGIRDITSNFDPNSLDPNIKVHIDDILELYADFTGYQLEEMTHVELPWINARRGVSPSERSENVISDNDMAACYSARLNA